MGNSTGLKGVRRTGHLLLVIRGLWMSKSGVVSAKARLGRHKLSQELTEYK